MVTDYSMNIRTCTVSLLQLVEGLPPSEMQSLLFCKVLARKPGWKDSNFQVMNAKFAVVATLVEKAKVFGKKSTTCVLSALVDKFADMKVRRNLHVHVEWRTWLWFVQVKVRSGDTLMVLSERMTLNYISLLVSCNVYTPRLRHHGDIIIYKTVTEYILWKS